MIFRASRRRRLSGSEASGGFGLAGGRRWGASRKIWKDLFLGRELGGETALREVSPPRPSASWPGPGRATGLTRLRAAASRGCSPRGWARVRSWRRCTGFGVSCAGAARCARCRLLAWVWGRSGRGASLSARGMGESWLSRFRASRWGRNSGSKFGFFGKKVWLGRARFDVVGAGLTFLGKIQILWAEDLMLSAQDELLFGHDERLSGQDEIFSAHDELFSGRDETFSARDELGLGRRLLAFAQARPADHLVLG